MVWVAVTLGVLFAGASFLVYRLREEGSRLMQAVENHFRVKNAPYGVSDVKIDEVDRILWRETGIL